MTMAYAGISYANESLGVKTACGTLYIQKFDDGMKAYYVKNPKNFTIESYYTDEVFIDFNKSAAEKQILSSKFRNRDPICVTGNVISDGDEGYVRFDDKKKISISPDTNNISVTIRHIETRMHQGIVCIYLVKNFFDELSNVSIKTNYGNIDIPKLGYSTSDAAAEVYIHLGDKGEINDLPPLKIIKVTAVKNGKKIDITKNTKEEKFFQQKIITK